MTACIIKYCIYTYMYAQYNKCSFITVTRVIIVIVISLGSNRNII